MKAVDKAIERIKWFVESAGRRVYLFFSGGRDSLALLALASYLPSSIRRKIVVVYTELMGNTAWVNRDVAIRAASHAGFDSRLVVECRRDACLRDVDLRDYNFLDIMSYSRKGRFFYEALVEYGPPVPVKSHGLWCRREFKTWKWLYLPRFPETLYSIVGLRRGESRLRAGLYRNYLAVNVLSRGSHKRLQVMLLPIYDWSDGEVEDFVKEAGFGGFLEPYRVAGDSLNCVWCPFKSKDLFLRALVALRDRPEWGYPVALFLCRSFMRLRPGSDTFTHRIVEDARWACDEAGIDTDI